MPLGTSSDSSPTPTDTQGRNEYLDIWQDRWNRTFVSQASYRVRTATFLYTDGNGLAVYRLSVVTPWGQTVTRELAYDPQGTVGRILVDPAKPQIPTEPVEIVNPLTAAKDRALSWVRDQLSAEALDITTAAQMMNQIKGFQDIPSLEKFMKIAEAEGLLPVGTFEPVHGDPTGGFLTSGSGGSGSAGPVYVEPDRRVVEDFVKGAMISLVGSTLDGRLSKIVDLYMSDHRKNFDVKERSIDPSQSVLEAIRGTIEYQRIHQNRPDTEDERTWISDRRLAAAQGGLTLNQQGDFAVAQATAAGDVTDVREAAAFTQLSRSGQAPDFLNNLVRSVARGMFQGVKR